MKRLIIPLLAVNLWFLHGLDVQFYTIQNMWLFDINLYLSVMTTFICIVLLLIGPSEKYGQKKYLN